MNNGLKYFCFCIFILYSFSCSYFGENESEMERLGPDARATLVIYFKPGTTDEQIEQFDSTLISGQRADGRGKKSKPGIWSVLRLLPSQANNHEAIAITFHDDATEEQIRNIKESVQSSEIVHKVFENIAPKDIKLN